MNEVKRDKPLPSDSHGKLRSVACKQIHKQRRKWAVNKANISSGLPVLKNKVMLRELRKKPD